MSNRTFVRRVIKGGYYLNNVSGGKMDIDFIFILRPNRKTEIVLASIKMRFRKLLKNSEISITDFENKTNDTLRDLINLKGGRSLLQPIRESYFNSLKPTTY
jgi:hypothetical protein